MSTVNFYNLIEFYSKTGGFVIFNTDSISNKNEKIVTSVIRNSGVWKNVLNGTLSLGNKTVRTLKFFVSFRDKNNLTDLNMLKTKFASTKDDGDLICYLFEINKLAKKKHNPKTFSVSVISIYGGGKTTTLFTENVESLGLAELNKCISKWANMIGIENTAFEFFEVEELSGGYGVGGSKFIREKTYI